MKKTVTAVLCLVIVLLFVGCGKADISKVKIDYGTSSVRRKKEAVHGRLTKNTNGHGGLREVKVENGS